MCGLPWSGVTNDMRTLEISTTTDVNYFNLEFRVLYFLLLLIKKLEKIYIKIEILTLIFIFFVFMKLISIELLIFIR